MTFDELYKYYLQQSFTKPLEGIQTLNVQQPIPTINQGGADGDSMGSGITGVSPATGTGITSTMSDLGQMALSAVMSAINPAMGFAMSIANPNSLANQAVQSIANALGLGGSGSTGTGMGTDTGDMGSEAANNAATDAANASVGIGGDDGGDGGDGGADGAGDGGDGYAYGGRVNFNEGTEPTNQLKYIEPNINYTTSSQGPVKTQVFESIIKGNLPLDDKWKILGELGIIDNRMKFGDFLYKFKDIQRSLGIGYDSKDGLSGFLKYNVDTKEPQAGIQYKKTFQNGGRVNYLQGGLSSLLGNYYGKR